MIPRRLRVTYFRLFRGPMRINGLVYRYLRQPAQPISVHLGPGRHAIRQLRGWVSLDANIVTARPDVWANMLDPLPFRNDSVLRFYSYHVIEHLPDDRLPGLFKELFRCLVPGGGIRIGGPHAENSARKLLERDVKWFSDFPDKRASIGGRFANFLLCRNEHTALLTPSYLEELASDAGFEQIAFPLVTQESKIAPDILAGEDESDLICPHTVIVEARKPGCPFRNTMTLMRST
jgi:predicted SAM-dependent methyltransferase